MSDDLTLSRRNLGALAAGAVAIAAIPAVASAQGADDPMLTGGSWFDQIRAQHQEIDRLFTRIQQSGGRDRGAFERLKRVLSAHSFAEDAVIYPVLANMGDRGQAKHLYDEQDDAAILLGRLDNMPPSDPRWMDTLNHLAEAVRAHAHEEESGILQQIRDRAGPMNGKMTAEFRRHYQAYVQA